MTSPNEPPGMPFGDVTFRAKSTEREKNARVLGCVAPKKVNIPNSLMCQKPKATSDVWVHGIPLRIPL